MQTNTWRVHNMKTRRCWTEFSHLLFCLSLYGTIMVWSTSRHELIHREYRQYRWIANIVYVGHARYIASSRYWRHTLEFFKTRDPRYISRYHRDPRYISWIMTPLNCDMVQCAQGHGEEKYYLSAKLWCHFDEKWACENFQEWKSSIS